MALQGPTPKGKWLQVGIVKFILYLNSSTRLNSELILSKFNSVQLLIVGHLTNIIWRTKKFESRQKNQQTTWWLVCISEIIAAYKHTHTCLVLQLSYLSLGKMVLWFYVCSSFLCAAKHAWGSKWIEFFGIIVPFSIHAKSPSATEDSTLIWQYFYAY